MVPDLINLGKTMIGRPLKKISLEMQNLSADLENVHNSDSYHELFDIYNALQDEYPDLAKLVDHLIAERFGKSDGSSETQWKYKEIHFILSHLTPAAKREFRKVQWLTGDNVTSEDIQQEAMKKILVTGSYDHTNLENVKIGYINKSATDARIDLVKALQSRDNRARDLHEYATAADPFYPKRLDPVYDEDDSEGD